MKAGDIVWVKFPYEGKSADKPHPALVLDVLENGQAVLAYGSSQHVDGSCPAANEVTVTRLLTDVEGTGELDDPGVFQNFMTDIAEVVCNHCGGEVRNPAEPFEDVWYVGIHGNDSLPDAFGGIWREYDKEGELFAETSAEALAEAGVTDYCNQVCGGGNCGTDEVCQYGIDAQTHLPPTARNVFAEVMDAHSVTVEAPDAVEGQDTVELRRDLLAAAFLSKHPGDTVITRDHFVRNAAFGEALMWLSPFFEFPTWEGRKLGELLQFYGFSSLREDHNVLQYRTKTLNKDGIHGRNVTLAELGAAAPLPNGSWLLADQVRIQLAGPDRSPI